MTLKEIQKINRLEELNGHYYPMPEDVYDWIPVEYRVAQGFSFKRLLGVCVSLWLFVGTIKGLMNPDIPAENVWASIPLFVMALLIFVFSVSPHLHVEKDSQIIEATVKKVEKHNLYFLGRKYVVHIVTLFVPSMKREVIAHLQKKASEGTHIVIVKNKNYHFFIHMNEYYVPKYISEDEKNNC
ncbi:MAG: hypothetical protein Q4D51_09935 [Eubacteriales bacterium]|nr:hypothetical protein [Eubacteriales bacterium]